MASNVLEGNGEPTQQTHKNDVKIIVVGDEKVGKSKFIETFAKRFGNASGDHYSMEFAKVYQCRYEIQRTVKDVKIFEILGGPDDSLNLLTKDHFDANGIIFMYAIDDPTSFERIPGIWYPTLKGNGCLNYQPHILVANKKDLRLDERVIQRLAHNNQSPVTEEQGKSLAEDKRIEFYECVSTDENDRNIHDAFHKIVDEGLLDWNQDLAFSQAEN